MTGNDLLLYRIHQQLNVSIRNIDYVASLSLSLFSSFLVIVALLYAQTNIPSWLIALFLLVLGLITIKWIITLIWIWKTKPKTDSLRKLGDKIATEEIDYSDAVKEYNQLVGRK